MAAHGSTERRRPRRPNTRGTGRAPADELPSDGADDGLGVGLHDREKVRHGTTKKVPGLWMARHDGRPFRIEDVADRFRLGLDIEEFQNAVRVRAQDRET